MGWNGLERNKLDFILSDLLPVELSELVSYTSLYSFLLEEKQKKILDSMVIVLRKSKKIVKKKIVKTK